MKRSLNLFFVILLALGFAFAQQGSPFSSINNTYDEGECGECALEERIRIIIPERLAFHLTEDAFTVDLGNLEQRGPSYEPGRRLEGDACYYVPRDVEFAFSPEPMPIRPMELGAWTSQFGLQNGPNYPAVVLEGDTLVGKGYLFCVNNKYYQVFSNLRGGWRLTIDAEMESPVPDPGDFGQLWLSRENTNHQEMQFIPGGLFDPTSYPTPMWITDPNFGPLRWDDFIAYDGVTPGFSVNGHVVVEHTGVTNGWYDGEVTEAVFFDGTELEGNYTILLTFTLTKL